MNFSGDSGMTDFFFPNIQVNTIRVIYAVHFFGSDQYSFSVLFFSDLI